MATLTLPHDRLRDFCKRWRIQRLEVFGSILGPDFGPESDVDFLVTWSEDTNLTLYDLIRAEDELSSLLGRRADLLERQAVEDSPNWLLRKSILDRTEDVYEEAG